MKLKGIIILILTLLFFACTKDEFKDIVLQDSPFAIDSGVDLIVIDSGNIEGTGIFAIGHIYYKINWEPFKTGDTLDELRIYRGGELVYQSGKMVSPGSGESIMYYKDLDVTQGPWFDFEFCFYKARWGETKRTNFGMSS